MPVWVRHHPVFTIEVGLLIDVKVRQDSSEPSDYPERLIVGGLGTFCSLLRKLQLSTVSFRNMGI
jgi:hypothetical protein